MQVNNSVVCSMLCERCYRHLLAAPLSVDADCIQCTSLCPTGNGHYSAMSDQEVRFEEVLNIAQSLDEYVNYHGHADAEHSAKSIDFALFDKNLSVLLKRHHGEEPSPAVSNPNSSKHGHDPNNSTHPSHHPSSKSHETHKHLDSHGIEGHRIRNSRDLTKILRSNSGISAGSVSSVENSNTNSTDSKTEELHLLNKNSESYLQAMETANIRHAHLEKYHKTRALPPDPPNSPKNLIAVSPGGTTTSAPTVIQTSQSDLSKGQSDSGKASVGSLTNNMNTIKPSAYKAASFEVIPFVVQLWEGITIKIVYSSKPLVEKTRVVYLRGCTERANKLIRERLVPIGTEVTAAHRNYTHTALLDALHSTVLQLCWGRRSVMGTVSFSAEKCLDMDTVKHIKVGTGVWAQCINIGSSTGRTLVLKIEEQALFTLMLDGITALVATRQKDNTHGAESK